MSNRKYHRSNRAGSHAAIRQRGTMTPDEMIAQWTACHALVAAATPLGADCGQLCGARCCAGGPEDGMLLFPGEELLYTEETLPAGWHLRDSGIRLSAYAAPIALLVCDGTCTRVRRPLSCRIFPLLPRVDARGGIRIEPDLRALSICPLLFDSNAPHIRASFAKAVQDAFTLAIRIPGVTELLMLLQQENREISRFYR